MSSCLSTFRSCAPSGSFQRPSSSAAPSLSTAVLRAARSCDHAPLLNAAENVDLELGGGNRISSNRRNELFDPMDLTADVLSSGFELVSHGVRVTALAMLHPSLEVSSCVSCGKRRCSTNIMLIRCRGR